MRTCGRISRGDFWGSFSSGSMAGTTGTRTRLALKVKTYADSPSIASYQTPYLSPCHDSK